MEHVTAEIKKCQQTEYADNEQNVMKWQWIKQNSATAEGTAACCYGVWFIQS
jgi:hypothetical protein